MYNFGQRLRELRKSKGLQQSELAEALGLNGAAISKYETGRTVPDAYTLSKAASFLGVTTDYLLGSSTDFLLGDNTISMIKKIAKIDNRRFNNAMEHLILKGIELYCIERWKVKQGEKLWQYINRAYEEAIEREKLMSGESEQPNET